MRTKIYFLLLFAAMMLSAAAESIAQTATVKINFGSPQAGSAVCKVRTLNGRYEVIVAGALQPEAPDLQNVSVRFDGNNVIYSFKPAPNTEALCQTVQNGLEITFTASSGQSAGGNAAVTPTPTPTVKPITPEEKKEAKTEALDLSIPESPGFTILGLNPQSVVRPTSPREFVAKLINSLDENGNIQNGVAFDMAPYLLLSRGRLTLSDYRNFKKDKENNFKKDKDGFRIPRFSLERFFSRIQYSLATTKGASSEDKSARIGTGLHFTIFDYGDPRMDQRLDQCFLDLTKEIQRQATINILGFVPANEDDITGEQEDRIQQEITRLLDNGFRERYKKECIGASKKRNFGRSSFVIGGAKSWISKTGDSSKFVDNGEGLWASLAYGFEGLRAFRCDDVELMDEDNRCIQPQLIFHYRRRVKETVPNPLVAGQFTTKDSKLFGTRLRIGVPKWSVNLEGVFSEERYAGRTSSHDWIGSFGADYKLADNFYLNFSVGGKTKESNIPNTGKVFIR
ncbi:MAG TPA: hypothetical protein VF721_22245, partial [Pyrinomonadaceae bacterium]